ncbi:DUF4823 domain-containing protein [Vibrio kasasachensis]|uniref:DUF4823 domain-containing protein n=1 Tax=Vibrio kasasachensis TaxID=2910248 RepID=UPI003D0A32E3
MININIKSILVALTALSISACSSTAYHVNAINGQTLKGENKISLNDSNFYLVNGGDGRMMSFTSLGESDEKAEGSGISALNIASDSLSKFTQLIVVENNELTEDKALDVAKTNNNDYLIYSRVEQWSDPLGINCGTHYYDEASVLLSIYSVKDRKLINTSRLAAKSCPTKLNGFPLSPGSPENLYSDLFSKWVNENFNI